MKVFLAGYNVDTEILRQLQDKAGKRQDLTPEVISAAYARISRDPRPIDEIRESSRQQVERSRKSNSTIIFKMGHHSVAEHAVFNLDILGVSRLCMEELEKFRLCSYTEKSQRYITLDKDFVIPDEIKNSGLEKLFTDTIALQNEAYFKLLKQLKDYTFDKHAELASDPKKHNLLEGWAKEDARYITALATESQVGQTVNGRTLELLLRRFASSSLAEVQKLGRAIYEQISEIAPSIVIFYQANDRDQKTYQDLKAVISDSSGPDDLQPVKLVEYDKDGDNNIIAALIHTSSSLSYQKCKDKVKKLSQEEKQKILKTSWQNLQLYDSMLREFEYANLTFDIVLSAACFGQLKRHRMSTITSQSYDPAFGITIPDAIKEIKMEGFFKEITDKTEAVYSAIKKEAPLAAPYILTNAHQKRVLMRLNARELYHISRLREDAHAQWDIHNISREMTRLAKEAMPLTFGLTGGKDKYKDIYRNIFGKAPKIAEITLPGARKIKP